MIGPGDGAVHSVDDILKACADLHPDRLAVTLGDERASFGEIDRWADAFAQALQGWGVGRGTPVLVICDLSIEQIALHFAMARIGAIFIPANPAFSEAELADLTICCGMFLGMGRTLAVVGVRAPDERILV